MTDEVELPWRFVGGQEALAFSGHDVRVFSGAGAIGLAEAVLLLNPSMVVLVQDEGVAGIHGGEVGRTLARALSCPLATVAVPAGEKAKQPGQLERLWWCFRRGGLDRDAVIVALGGGACSDLAGFAAATWLRGIRWVAAPTTLLAQVDAAIGGKVAIDLDAKNLVGTFHAPAVVVADVAWLDTLPPAERRSGLGEVWKTAILAGGEDLEALEGLAEELGNVDRDATAEVVRRCVRHKLRVVQEDPLDRGPRASLNLGHTLGHAVETLLGLRHGEAVAIGTSFAVELARNTGHLTHDHGVRFHELGRALRLPGVPPRRLTWDELAPLIARDKKASRGRVRWILPTGPGTWARDAVDDEVVRATLADFHPEDP